ncbi:signal peptidase I [Halalkalibacter alkalisediminis]|uniref:Signal peptidase I n=1 Tax=Halalkalibacter alkalisediminis TaxID=935616 RepID=A0ABV6NLT5_9BACI|nr:signal peptidase I [Halalkalibacter alkalisediminis]
MLNKKIIGEIFSWSKALLFALSISIIVSVFILQPFIVSGSSMDPTLDGEDPFNKAKIGDRVLIYKSGYILGEEPKYNDIVIIDSRIDKNRSMKDDLFESPIVSMIFGSNDSDKKVWIKRIIGEEGDTLEYKDGRVYRNGEELIEDYIKEDMTFPFETIVVPENHVFVMGDNRNGSLDSRKIGPVPNENILGKVFLRFYPFDKIRKF